MALSTINTLLYTSTARNAFQKVFLVIYVEREVRWIQFPIVMIMIPFSRANRKVWIFGFILNSLASLGSQISRPRPTATRPRWRVLYNPIFFILLDICRPAKNSQKLMFEIFSDNVNIAKSPFATISHAHWPLTQRIQTLEYWILLFFMFCCMNHDSWEVLGPTSQYITRNLRCGENVG